MDINKPILKFLGKGKDTKIPKNKQKTLKKNSWRIRITQFQDFIYNNNQESVVQTKG